MGWRCELVYSDPMLALVQLRSESDPEATELNEVRLEEPARILSALIWPGSLG